MVQGGDWRDVSLGDSIEDVLKPKHVPTRRAESARGVSNSSIFFTLTTTSTSKEAETSHAEDKAELEEKLH